MAEISRENWAIPVGKQKKNIKEQRVVNSTASNKSNFNYSQILEKIPKNNYNSRQLYIISRSQSLSLVFIRIYYIFPFCTLLFYFILFYPSVHRYNNNNLSILHYVYYLFNNPRTHLNQRMEEEEEEEEKWNDTFYYFLYTFAYLFLGFFSLLFSISVYYIGNDFSNLDGKERMKMSRMISENEMKSMTVFTFSHFSLLAHPCLDEFIFRIPTRIS